MTSGKSLQIYMVSQLRDTNDLYQVYHTPIIHFGQIKQMVLNQIELGNGLLPDAPNHYLNQWYLIISSILHHFPEDNGAADAKKSLQRFKKFHI